MQVWRLLLAGLWKSTADFRTMKKVEIMFVLRNIERKGAEHLVDVTFAFSVAALKDVIYITKYNSVKLVSYIDGYFFIFGKG